MEIVIAMTEENEATCKRFFKEDGYYRLQPENDTMDPIILENVTILGKVVGLYRDLKKLGCIVFIPIYGVTQYQILAFYFDI